MLSEVPDGYATLLARGIAAALDEWGIANYAGPGQPVDPTAELPVFIGAIEPAAVGGVQLGARLLVIPREALEQPNHVTDTPVGFNWRGPEGGNATDGLNFLDLLRRRLHRLSHYTFGTIPIGKVSRQSSGLIGADSKTRQVATATYIFRGFNRTVN